MAVFDICLSDSRVMLRATDMLVLGRVLALVDALVCQDSNHAAVFTTTCRKS